MLDERLKPRYPEEQLAVVLRGFLCLHLVAAFRSNVSSIIQFLDNVAQFSHNLLGMVKSPKINGANSNHIIMGEDQTHDGNTKISSEETESTILSNGVVE